MRGARDYSQGKVYKVVDIETDECYVGSTLMPLCKRLSTHKKRGQKTGVYKHFSQAEVGWHRARIVLVEDFPCDRVDQLRAREEHWRVQLGATLNRQRAHAGLPEGAPSQAVDKQGYNAAYHTANREAINARKRERINCSHCGVELVRQSLTRHIRRMHPQPIQ